MSWPSARWISRSPPGRRIGAARAVLARKVLAVHGTDDVSGGKQGAAPLRSAAPMWVHAHTLVALIACTYGGNAPPGWSEHELTERQREEGVHSSPDAFSSFAQGIRFLGVHTANCMGGLGERAVRGRRDCAAWQNMRVCVCLCVPKVLSEAVNIHGADTDLVQANSERVASPCDIWRYYCSRWSRQPTLRTTRRSTAIVSLTDC